MSRPASSIVSKTFATAWCDFGSRRVKNVRTYSRFRSVATNPKAENPPGIGGTMTRGMSSSWARLTASTGPVPPNPRSSHCRSRSSAEWPSRNFEQLQRRRRRGQIYLRRECRSSPVPQFLHDSTLSRTSTKRRKPFAGAAHSVDGIERDRRPLGDQMPDLIGPFTGVGRRLPRL
jgi:hypothetical protein